MAKAKPIRPSAALAATYEKRLLKSVDEMHASIMRFVVAAYRRTPPRLAMDDLSHTSVKSMMSKLGRRWLRNFDRLAPKLADYFAQAASERVDSQLKAMLRDHGMTVQFRMSAAQREVVGSVVQQNVSLIKSIAERHLTNVQGVVMRSVATGRDIGGLTKALQENFGVTRRRAAFIARSQNEMATSALQRARQLELGITTAKWLHSAGGHAPRPSHVHQSGKTYDVKKGWFDPEAEEWCWPGSLPNCRCVSVPVIEVLL